MLPAPFPSIAEPHQRLAWARQRARFPNATEAARRYHWNENTYRSHENGTRGLSKKAAAIYARAFKVSVQWLLFGDAGGTPTVDPELIYLWDDLTAEQRVDLIRYAKMLAREVA